MIPPQVEQLLKDMKELQWRKALNREDNLNWNKFKAKAQGWLEALEWIDNDIGINSLIFDETFRKLKEVLAL